jgi:hypothetical protein
LPEPEYVYRFPPVIGHVYLAILFVPPLLFAIAAGIVGHSWLLGFGLTLPVVLGAFMGHWVWSKAIIVIDSERIRWPLKRRELRWDDVSTSEIARCLGTEYVRVETKRGKVRRIVLNRVGGRDYRAHVLAKLGLT